MTMKKKILTTLSVVLILGMAALGILAYLTDTDNDVNVMTLGKVDIEQYEKDQAGNDFEDQPLYPAVGELVQSGDYWTNANVVDKIVTVENTGKSNAYVRTWFAFEYGDADSYTKVKTNLNDEWEWTDIAGTTEIEGVNYVLAVATYDEELEPGDITPASLRQVALLFSATNEDMVAFGDEYKILVFTQAIQTAGFENAATALAEGFGAATVENHPWLPKKITVDSVEELNSALESVKPGDIIDANGVTIDINSNEYCESLPGGSYGYNIPAGVTIKGASFKGNYRGGNYVIFTEGEDAVVFDDCTFECSGQTLLLGGTSNGPDSVVYNNCTFKGAVITNFVDNTSGVAEFNICSFKKAEGGLPAKNYIEAMGGTHNFNGCTFDYTGVTQSAMGVITSGQINVYSESGYSTIVNLNDCTRINCGTRKYGPNSTLNIK